MSSESPAIPHWARVARAQWHYTGRERPSFAIAPAAGQESVWDYPRPPRIATDEREVVVQMEGFLLARSVRTLRVLETASPPTFYIPLADIQSACLRAAGGSSRCEWKGQSRYWSVMVNGALLEAVAWSYPEPLPGFEAIRDHLSFYPARLQCTLAGTRVHPQPGSFYGGWVTPDVVGPFKGEPGSASW